MDSNHLHRLRGLPAASISGTIGTVHPFHKAEDDQAASGGSLFGIYLMRASIAGIPELLYGSAAVTGANEWTEKWRIALPLSLPGLATLAVRSFVGTWNSYVCPQVVIQDRAKQLLSFGLWQLSRSVGGSFEHRAG